MHGFTENYIKVKAPFEEGKVNSFQNVTYTRLDSDGVMSI
jgi:threonylcarbamoyladenosine tRNA methylthiotransferase MtaB